MTNLPLQQRSQSLKNISIKRVQLYKDAHKEQYFRIDGNTGQTLKIDRSGQNLRSYHTNITGVAKPDRRIEKGLKSGNEAMMPQVDSKVNLWKPDVLRQTIQKMNLSHFLPRKTPREKMVLSTNTKEVLSSMQSFQTCSQYGWIPIHAKEKIIKTSAFFSSSDVKPVQHDKKLSEPHKKVSVRDDHIVLVAH